MKEVASDYRVTEGNMLTHCSWGFQLLPLVAALPEAVSILRLSS
jgi:hypothetical protein